MLTAPALIAFFAKKSGENTINEADVNCAALLMMQKKCEKGVTVRNINEIVKEILEQTGFDSILNITG